MEVVSVSPVHLADDKCVRWLVDTPDSLSSSVWMLQIIPKEPDCCRL